MEVLATGWAPTRTAAIAFFEACAIARLDTESNEIRSIADVIVHPQRPTETITITKLVDGEPVIVPGWHFNLKFHSASAETLTAGLPQVDDNGNPLGLFERTRILQMVAARVAEPVWEEVTVGGVPGGYSINAPGELFNGVRCFDPAVINTPRLVIQ